MGESFSEAAALGEALRAACLTVAVAESCTGGLLGAALTAIPGSSAWFQGGVIAYSNGVKHDLLGVSADALARWGAVSEPVAREMAEGARTRCGANLGVAITGVAGPDAEGTDKPVGTIHIVVAGPGAAATHRRLNGDRGREHNRTSAVLAALHLCAQQVATETR